MKIDNNSLKNMVEALIEQHKEGNYYDFKQEWHENIEDLIKDIICFANTVHDKNCYIIFGVTDNYEVVGMQKESRKQADIINTLSNLQFAGDIVPRIEVKKININSINIDVLIIFDVKKTPVFLKKQYGKMYKGCIYTRNEDKNTPDKGNANIEEIENLWKKRLGLTKPALEFIYDNLCNEEDWNILNDYSYYYVYKPQYTLTISYEEDSHNDMFYSYSQTNESTSFEELYIKDTTTILDSYQLVVLDGGRLRVPTPKIGHIYKKKNHYHPYTYGYYVMNSHQYSLLKFLYHPEKSDEKNAYNQLMRVIVLYKSETEKNSFEKYIQTHPSELKKIKNFISNSNEYEIQTESKEKTKEYKKCLRAGLEINKLLNKWRKEVNQKI